MTIRLLLITLTLFISSKVSAQSVYPGVFKFDYSDKNYVISSGSSQYTIPNGWHGQISITENSHNYAFAVYNSNGSATNLIIKIDDAIGERPSNLKIKIDEKIYNLLVKLKEKKQVHSPRTRKTEKERCTEYGYCNKYGNYGYHYNCRGKREISWYEESTRDILEVDFLVNDKKIMTFKGEKNIKINTSTKSRGSCRT
jgi:hypothetical protein